MLFLILASCSCMQFSFPRRCGCTRRKACSRYVDNHLLKGKGGGVGRRRRERKPIALPSSFQMPLALPLASLSFSSSSLLSSGHCALVLYQLIYFEQLDWQGKMKKRHTIISNSYFFQLILSPCLPPSPSPSSPFLSLPPVLLPSALAPRSPL